MEKEISRITLESIRSIKDTEERNNCKLIYKEWIKRQREQDRLEVNRYLRLKNKIRKIKVNKNENM